MVTLTRTPTGGYAVSRTKLERAIEHVKVKVDAVVDADDSTTRARWKQELHYAWVRADNQLVNLVNRLLSEDHYDPRSFTIFLEVLRDGGKRCYRSASAMGREHLEAFWLVREEVMTHQRTRSAKNGAKQHRTGDDLYKITFEDPSKAGMICSVIRTHGLVSVTEMRNLLTGIDEKATMLAEGLL